MGMIKIEVSGSFGIRETKTFSAINHGHAHAVNDAISYLVGLQKDAINNDHKCHDDNIKPEAGFQKSRSLNYDY